MFVYGISCSDKNSYQKYTKFIFLINKNKNKTLFFNLSDVWIKVKEYLKKREKSDNLSTCCVAKAPDLALSYWEKIIPVTKATTEGKGSTTVVFNIKVISVDIGSTRAFLCR